jgi:hypothetical protein
MRRFALLCAGILLCVVTSQAQEAVKVEGRPALKFDTGEGWSMIAFYTEYKGAPAFEFGPTNNWGEGAGKWVKLYVSRDRVAHDEYRPNAVGPGFDVSRAEAQSEWVHQGPKLLLKLPTRDYKLELWCGRAGYVQPCSDDDDLRVFMLLAISDFDKAVQEFEKRTASLRPTAPAPAQTEPVKLPPPPPPPPTLALSLQPANVQVYVDDVFKGMTSAEGRLVVEGLALGSHRVRMNLIGYTEAARTVELKAGETAAIEAKLEPAGPKPLALAEIEEALSNGLPPKGITKLVNQYGVDFTLTKEVEQRLRDKGADSDLLVAIATNKK